MTQYIFITGGVLSSLGKGVTAAALGALLEGMGYTVDFLKLDPYLNIDPGTMDPYQHGEVFVTGDGAETDLDLGHYERFTRVVITKNNNATAGKLYARLLEKERRGDFLGSTVQIIPHFTQEIKDMIYALDKTDIVIVEIGGTVGDIESLPFIEAIRQIGLECPAGSKSLFIHMTYVPYLEHVQELKTKPTQHSVKALCALGVQPDILLGRSSQPLSDDIKRKIALFSNIHPNSVISVPDLATIYQAPLYFYQEGLGYAVTQKLGLVYREPDLRSWSLFCDTLAHLDSTVTIALVGKYVHVKDSYKSVYESLLHAQVPAKSRVIIKWVDATQLTKENSKELLGDVDGILVPGGFGERGVEGKIEAVRFARTNKIPYLGICLGMQVAAIEFARNVLRLTGANSTEFDPVTPDPVVSLLTEQKSITYKGATMRLGNYTCALVSDSKISNLYNAPVIIERHRHRYELNNAYVPLLHKAGFRVVGWHENQELAEIIELENHPFFIASQFHPEFLSRPYSPHPLFKGLVNAARVAAEAKRGVPETVTITTISESSKSATVSENTSSHELTALMTQLLKRLSITPQLYEHEAIFTLEDEHKMPALPGAVVKNLFLKDRAGRYWLVVTLTTKRVNLRDLARDVGTRDLSFAQAHELRYYLGVEPGSATPLGLLADKERLVTVILDNELFQHDLIGVHPLRNTATVLLAPTDLVMFLEALSYTPHVLSLSRMDSTPA